MAFKPGAIPSLDAPSFSLPRETLFANRIVEQGMSRIPDAQRVEDPTTKSQMAKFSRLFRQANNITDDEAAERHRKQVEEEIMNFRIPETPSVRRRKQETLDIWHFALELHAKESDREDDFCSAVVLKYYMYFLPTAISILRPRYHGTQVSARTFLTIMKTFVMHIVKFTWTVDDRGDHIMAGYAVLRTGVYKALNSQAVQLIFQHNLNRQFIKKLYYGYNEVRMIICSLLEASKTSPGRRVVAMQVICQMLVVFYATLRPSSMGSLDKEHRALGIYPRLRNIKIMKNGNMDYVVHFEVEHHKGSLRSALAEGSKTIILDSVSRSQNTIVDPTLAFLSYLFMRGVFQKDYQTLEELFSDESSELMLSRDKLDQPLFLAAKEKGEGFINSTTSASTLQASHSISRAAFRARLPGGSAYHFRRDTADALSQQSGLRVAQSLMNHEEARTVFSESYSRGDGAIISLTGIRLGEIAGANESAPGEWLKNQKKRELFRSIAVEAMTRFEVQGLHKNLEISSENLKKSIIERNSVMALRSEPVLRIEMDIFVQWMRAIGEFRGSVVPKTICTGSVNILINGVKSPNPGKLELINGEKKTVVLEILESIKEDIEHRNKIYKKHEKQNMRDQQAEYRQSYLKKDSTLTGTIEQRREARDRLEKPDPLTETILQSHLKEGVTATENEPTDNVRQPLKFTGDVEEYCRRAQENINEHSQRELEEAEHEKLCDSFMQKLGQSMQEPHETSITMLRSKVHEEDASDDEDDELHPVLNKKPGINHPQILNEVNANEEDILGDMPVSEIKKEMMRVFCGPSLIGGVREMDIDRGAPVCHVCGKVEQGHLMLRRHHHRTHSEWGKLKNDIKKSQDGFRCPFEQCSDSGTFATARRVEVHMLSDACKNHLMYRTMKAAYQKANPVIVEKKSAKETSVPNSHMDMERAEKALRSNMMILSILSTFSQNPESMTRLLGTPSPTEDETLRVDYHKGLDTFILRIPKHPFQRQSVLRTPVALKQLDYTKPVEYPDMWDIELNEFRNNADLDVDNAKFFSNFYPSTPSAALNDELAWANQTIPFNHAIQAMKEVHDKGMRAMRNRY